MTRRFYVDGDALGGDRIEIDGALAHRFAKVLRLRIGDEVILFDGSGDDVRARIDEISDRRVVATAIERLPGPSEAKTNVHLYQSITKGERFEWLVEKATELGVHRIVPLVSARAVVKTPAEGNRIDRWRRIAVEAAEQCGRGVIPDIDPPQSFAEATESAPGIVLMPYESADHTAPNVQDAMAQRIDELFAAGAVSILIGPEGGYEPEEVARAEEAGAIVVSLGERVLRSETAGLVALTLVMHAIGELG